MAGEDGVHAVQLVRAAPVAGGLIDEQRLRGAQQKRQLLRSERELGRDRGVFLTAGGQLLAHADHVALLQQCLERAGGCR